MNTLICVLAIISLVYGVTIIILATDKTLKNHDATLKRFIGGILLSTLSIPFLINELYRYGGKTGIGYHTLWEAKDVLAFYGSFLAFLGTVSLGALALYQNQKFKKENDLAQEKIEGINNKLLTLEDKKEKDKLFEIYFSYLDETEKLFDPIFILGTAEERRSIIQIYTKIKSCHINILSKKRRLLFLDKENADKMFFQYIQDKSDELTQIVMHDKDESSEVTSRLFTFWRSNSQEYNKMALLFISEIHNSIFADNN